MLPRWVRYVPFASLIIFVIPVSPNYNLRELNVGAGGDQSQSANYKVEQSFGELSGPMTGTSYKGGLGFGFTQMANVPPAPTFTNPSHYYNKLHVVLQTGNNPSDTVYAIAISNDSFVTTNYIKSDQGVGSSLTLTDYQTYSTWGGGSGFDVLGLDPGTTYEIKVKAKQGNFTESGYGPSSSAATENASLTFDIDVAATDIPSSPPYAIDMGTLLAGTINTASNKIWISLDTNALSGGDVYIAGQNGGLVSSSGSYTITSSTADLTVSSEGFGIQDSSVAQSSGGPLATVSPYNGASENVGVISTSFQKLFTSSAAITAGRGSAVLKAKASTSAPAKVDYTELLTVIASARF